MKKTQLVVIIALMVGLLALAGSGIFVASVINAQKEAEAEKEANKVSYDTFAAWTDIETFQTVPIMPGEGHRIGKATDYGYKDYMVDVNGTTVDDYKEYLTVLIDAGFKKHSDNGEDAMEGYVYTAAFTKDKLTVVVSHVIKDEKTYISATKNQPLSDHLIYKEEYMDGVTAGAKTSVSLVELGNNGASFVIQLKNGHFVVQDGGNDFDAPYLLDYLESLTPGDEKPVVEGWFISHPHGDHYGAIEKISTDISYRNRVYVNGVYFHFPPAKMVQSETTGSSLTCELLSGALISENGTAPSTYRPQLGQRYYFCDIIMDICMTTEQMNPEAMVGADVNDTSFWIMHHIDGQRVLTGGDAFHNNVRTIMGLLDESYFDVDVFAVLHHGINVYKYFIDYMKVDTLLYPSFRAGSLYSNAHPNFAREEENEYMRSQAKEAYSHGEGTVVLTFPYKVGTAETMPLCKWQYHNGMPPGRTTTDWGWEWDGLRYYYNN